MRKYDSAKHNSWIDLDLICFGQLYVVNNGGVLYSMDEFSLSLLIHPDILECSQNDKVGKLVSRAGKIDIWETEQNNNSENDWIGIFNRDSGKDIAIELTLKELGLDANREYLLKDLWSKADLPILNTFSFNVTAYGCIFIKYVAE